MMFNYMGYAGFNPFPGFWGMFLFPLVVWTLAWKGVALWKAAQKEDKVWFIALLLINTLGILEILYIYIFSKPKTSKKKK